MGTSATESRPAGFEAVRRFIDEQGIGYAVIEHEETFTAGAEARTAGVAPDHAAKAIMLRDDSGAYRMAVVPADEHLDLRKARRAAGAAALRLATEQELEADFPAFEVGALPPFAGLLGVPVTMDRQVLAHGRVLCNGGDHRHSVVLDSRDLERLAAAELADIVEGRSQGPGSAPAATRPTEPFRQEHAELVGHIEHIARAAREMPRLSEEERDALRGRILDFLRGTLIPHAQAEEEILYPEWARLVNFAGAATPMIHDHEAIVARVEGLARADVADVDALQALLYGLHALITVHFRKEEDLQLPAFDAAPEVAGRVLALMSARTGHAHGHHGATP